jgi:hypothetical protein
MKLPPVGLGSHLDTQPAGGRYDGIAGVLTALEVLRTIAHNNVETYAPLAVINWVSTRLPLSLWGAGRGGFENSWFKKFSLLSRKSDKRRRRKVSAGYALERRVGRCLYQEVWASLAQLFSFFLLQCETSDYFCLVVSTAVIREPIYPVRPWALNSRGSVSWAPRQLPTRRTHCRRTLKYISNRGRFSRQRDCRSVS